MDKIKIFLASSKELKRERDAFGNLIRQLDKIYEKWDARVDLFEWEDFDASDDGIRKQDQYNDEVRLSDMFLALFHKKAGKYTLEELDVARAENEKRQYPKVYIYCKDLQDDEEESKELAVFKDDCLERRGHFFGSFANDADLKLQFVMQFQQFMVNKHPNTLKHERAEKMCVKGGVVMLDDIPVVDMDSLQFAAGNEQYRQIRKELDTLPVEIEQLRQAIAAAPTLSFLKDQLAGKEKRFGELKEKQAQLQYALLDTALRMTALQQKKVSGLLQRAIDLFCSGRLEQANALLDEMAHDAEQHIKHLDQQRKLIHEDIRALRFQVATVMADTSFPLPERLQKINDIYAKADIWAEKSAYDRKEYSELLSDYADFLYDHAFYDEAIEILKRQIPLAEDLYGNDHPVMYLSYNKMRAAALAKGDVDLAIDYLNKNITIYDNLVGENHPWMAKIYMDAGRTLYESTRYDEALAWYVKAQAISRLSPDEKQRLNNELGNVLTALGRNEESLEYLKSALEIEEEKEKGSIQAKAALTNNIGTAYLGLKKYDKALACFEKALPLIENHYGTFHPEVAHTYQNLGDVYFQQKDYKQALVYHQKALNIRLAKNGTKHSKTADSYFCVAECHEKLEHYEESLASYQEAMKIREEVLGDDKKETAKCYLRVTQLLANRFERYDEALPVAQKYLRSCRKIFGEEHGWTAQAYDMIGFCQFYLGDYQNALENMLESLERRERLLGTEHEKSLKKRCRIAYCYLALSEYDHVLEYALPLEDACKGKIDPMSEDMAMVYDFISRAYAHLGQWDKVVGYVEKKLAIAEHLYGADSQQAESTKRNLNKARERSNHDR